MVWNRMSTNDPEYREEEYQIALAERRERERDYAPLDVFVQKSLDKARGKLLEETERFIDTHVKEAVDEIRETVESEKEYENAYNDLCTEIRACDADNPEIAYLLDYLDNGFMAVREALKEGREIHRNEKGEIECRI